MRTTIAYHAMHLLKYVSITVSRTHIIQFRVKMQGGGHIQINIILGLSYWCSNTPPKNQKCVYDKNLHTGSVDAHVGDGGGARQGEHAVVREARHA